MKQQASLLTTRKRIWRKWSIAFRIIPVVAVVALLKYLSHRYNFEIMELNALFTTLVAGTIFLIGFLITGVLSDYKESEKIPSDLAASIKSLFDDAYILHKAKNSEAASELMAFQKVFVNSLIDWLYKKERTVAILNKISIMNDHFVALDKEGLQPNYIIKMRNEQDKIRNMILRIDTIRDTEFIGSSYAIVEAMRFAIAIGFVIINIEPFYASLFFTTLVMFLLSYMLLLIKDLDNPFDYYNYGESGTKISLKPVRDLELMLKAPL
jgi:uncharacterized membrane protein YfbV (UPF0208 family)